MAEDPRIKRLRKLFEQVGELHEKLADMLDEADDILGGEASLGTRIKTALDAFNRVWSVRYGNGNHKAYQWQKDKAIPHMKKLVLALGVPEIERRFVAYVADDEKFLTDRRHPFALFVAKVNQYAAPAAAGSFDLQPPSDCRHEPPCKTDAEHTKRKAREMRQ